MSHGAEKPRVCTDRAGTVHWYRWAESGPPEVGSIRLGGGKASRERLIGEVYTGDIRTWLRTGAPVCGMDDRGYPIAGVEID